MRIYTIIHKTYGIICSFKNREEAENYLAEVGNRADYRIKVNILR